MAIETTLSINVDYEICDYCDLLWLWLLNVVNQLSLIVQLVQLMALFPVELVYLVRPFELHRPFETDSGICALLLF